MLINTLVLRVCVRFFVCSARAEYIVFFFSLNLSIPPRHYDNQRHAFAFC